MEQYLADVKRLGRRRRFEPREDLVVEICIAIADATGAHGLVRRLTTLFDGSSVSFDGTRNEVRVRSESESRTVVQVIDTVESWLAAGGVGLARLSIGERSYTMVGPALRATPGG